jgi:uncharacterized protein (TIGR02996 family)
MSDEEAFLQKIIENPDDDAPRLVFADWLEEHGQAERAEFIRVQCELARIEDEDDARHLDLDARARALLRTHHKEFSPLGNQLKKCQFRRGLVEGIDVAPDFFLKRAAKLFRLSPVRALDIRCGPDEVDAIAASVNLNRIATLDLGFSWLGDFRAAPSFLGSLKTLLDSPQLRNLTTLSIDSLHLRLEESGVGVLTSCLNLAGLRALHLYGHNLEAKGVEVLARGRYPSHLIKLGLGANKIHQGVRFLAESRQWPIWKNWTSGPT